jgi:hypothetical protein
MHVTPQAEHEWLKQLVGEWTYEYEAPQEDGTMVKFTGTETVRTLGDVWVQAEGRGPMPGGGESVMQLTLGYDPAKGKYVGTFIGSMMTYLWVYEGSVTEDGTRLELASEGPSFTDDGGTSRYIDTVQLEGPDRRLLLSRVQGADGTWQDFMRTEYTRVK